MAHVKSGGAAKRTVNIEGKRLGFKKFGGEHVNPGNIILRQRGTKFHPGNGVGIGRDHTIFATAQGFVHFARMTGFKRNRKIVHVLPEKDLAVVEVAVKKAPKAEVVKAEGKKPVAKTSAVKTTAKAKKTEAKPKAEKTVEKSSK